MKFNKQKIFNKVARHLLKQNAKAVNTAASCQYRGMDGTSCALGCLMPDELYVSRIEGCAIIGSVLNMEGNAFVEVGSELTSTDRKFKNIIREVTGAVTLEDFDFLADLQDVHDGNSPTVWEPELIALAKKHKLTFPRIAAKKVVK